MFNDFEEAVKTRLEAENKYYGEFAMQKNLFEKYGITQVDGKYIDSYQNN